MTLFGRRVRPDQWMPIGVEALEDNALRVVRSSDNRSVIAGPGAGKTELLAQRAAYLLQTGTAPVPQRILAISFKRDAASNLAARVQKRCHRSHASRLDSLTFDAFAKGIVDRFGQALPERWRPRPNYEIMLVNERAYRDFLQQEVGIPPMGVGTRHEVEELSVKEFERTHLLGAPLPVDGWPHPTVGEWAADRFWQLSLHAGSQSQLSFPMLGRLAELLLRTNPTIREALRLTYSHVFMDEFQDTTRVQYDLIRMAFLGSAAVMTAVGDNKQQIMRWANAMSDPFGVFGADFGAKRTPLLNNYRSSPDLVRIQYVLAQALDTGAVAPVSKTQKTVAGEICAILDFSTPEREATYLAEFVVGEMRAHGLLPRDVVLLVRQKSTDYFDILAPAFKAAGIALRNEAGIVGSVMLQELLAEEASDVLTGLLRLAMTLRAGRYWSKCQEMIADLWGIGDEDHSGQSNLARDLDTFATKLRGDHLVPPQDEAGVSALVNRVLAFVGRERLIAAYPAYRHGNWFQKVVESATLHLQASCEGTRDWAAALDAYDGVQAVPLMTIHKSKGLEYHTVIFVGLDDSAWWSFRNDRIEATAGFFVAFTRAKQRVVFTYCGRRGDRSQIASLYDLLRSGGVQTFPIT